MRKLGLALGGVGLFTIAFLILGGAAVFLKGRYDKQIIEDHDANRVVVTRDTAITALVDRQQARDVGYVRSVGTYRDVRDRTLRDNPDNQPARDIAVVADVVIDSADALRAVNDTLRDSLVTQVAAVKKLKKQIPPRISAYIMGGMDFISTQPIVQGGGEARIVGPLSVVGYVEAARATKAPNDTVRIRDRIEARGVVALKFTFR